MVPKKTASKKSSTKKTAAKKSSVKKSTAKKTTKKTTKKKDVLPESLNDIDVVFVLDVTGSMGPYIQEAKMRATSIARKVQEESGVKIRVGLIVYRDHPPQEYSFVAKVHDFVDIDEFDAIIAQYYAQGGGDHPEAVYDGIAGLFEMSWREGSDRTAYLIGDAPPHKNCLCGWTSDKLIAKLKELRIEINAHSIANEKQTTDAFNEFVQATDGVITTGNRPEHMSVMYSDSLTSKSEGIARSRKFISEAGKIGGYTSAAELSEASISTIAMSLGMSEEETKNTIRYLSKRGL